MGSSHRHGIDVLNRFATDVIQRSGQEAMKFYGKGKSDLKFDEELVTEAELHLADFFQAQVQERFPDHQVFMNGEMETEYSHEGKRYVWIFDPIDGADNFQTGIPVWAMSIALLENFWPIFGLINMPVTGDLYHAAAEKNAYRGDAEMKIAADESVDDESLLLTYSRFHQQYHAAFPGKIRNLGCTGAHICYVAMGRADAAVISNESFQDLAAARVIIESAGGKFFKMDGAEFFLNDHLDGQKIGEPLIVTSPEKISLVIECLEKTR